MNPEPQNSRDLYETWHAALEVDAETVSPWHGLVKKHLDLPRDLHHKRILEIGCGRGGFACWLARQPVVPAAIVAADFSSVAVEKGKAFSAEHGLGGISWEVNDIQAISHPAESFDTVVSCETIEHVPDPGLAVRELARVLKPGGRLFLTTPNYLGTLGFYRIYFRLRGRTFQEHGQPINNFMLLPWTRSMVQRAGLRVQKVDAVGHYLPFPGRPAIELPLLNQPKAVMKWLGLHSLIIAAKPTNHA